ncbi:MAG: hypothetical protein WC809_21990 [Sinimarinibacterium sp.]|jgi:hypothetical protein
MLDDQDPEFKRKAVAALLTPAHQRTAEQIMLVAQLKPELVQEQTQPDVSVWTLEEGDPPWLRALIGVLLFGLSLPLTPVLIRSVLHTEIDQLSFAGFVVLPAAWLAACVLLGFGYAGTRWLTRDRPGMRFFIDGVLVLMLVHTVYGWTR